MATLTVTVMWMDQTHGDSKVISAEARLPIPAPFVWQDRGVCIHDASWELQVTLSPKGRGIGGI